jgi:hypothetical protein
MAQRVTLAQTQLQLAQSNPQMHNLHAAYRRMYMALEVQNIDEILPPPPQPQPLDPALENARALMGELLQSFPDQDHDAHIKIHVMFMKTPLVTTSPQVMGTFYAHLLEHIGMKARLSVTQEIENLIIKVQEQVQMGNVDPNAAQQQIAEVQQNMQNPAEMEKLVAIQQLEIMQETLADLIPPGQDAMADPLVQIRMQELQIKKQDADRKASTDKSELLLEAAKMEQRAVTDAARIESSEDIAGNRNDVNRERIEVQRQGMNRRG